MNTAFSTIAILLATYNGTPFLQVQLDSIAAQRGVKWRLIASDDGSHDTTREILQRFAARFPDQVVVLNGPQQGASANFLHMIAHVRADEALAFCDQDDMWLPDKLYRAMSRLHGIEGPALYGSSTMITDHDLNPQVISKPFLRPLTLKNILVQVPFGGNTMLANPAATRLLRQGAKQAAGAGIISHDWWAALVVSACGGSLLRDEDPTLLYRQHGRNEVGRNDTLRGMAARFTMLSNGQFGDWLYRNLAALDAYKDTMPETNKAFLTKCASALTRIGPVAALCLWRLGVYRQTNAGTIALFLAAVLGALRPPARRQANPMSDPS